ncbi:MAG TPA: ATP synthase F0 subunit C [Terriglobia bacterium]|nr:ATP synthase F0 subunit C [Terriglobia bacterium]
MRKLQATLLLTFIVLMLSTPVFAQAAAAATTSHADWVVISAGFAMAIASSICGLAQGRAISAACEGLARNPGAAPAIRFALLLGLALIESLAIYTLVIIFVKVA